MLCNRCGTPNPDDSSACSRCGHKLLTRFYAPEDSCGEDVPLLGGPEGPQEDAARRAATRKELEAWGLASVLGLASLAAWLGFGLWPLAVAVPLVALAAWLRRV